MPTQQQLDAFTLAFHETAVARMAARPELTQRALQTLDRWCEQRGSSASDLYMQQWRQLLGGDLAALRDKVCVNNNAAATLRNTSPLGFVLTSAERHELRLRAMA